MGDGLFHAERIFDGTLWHEDASLRVVAGRVAGIEPGATGAERLAGWIVPGLIDLQVNGGGGVLFNNAPTAEGIATIRAAHARFGTTALMVTLITDRPDVTAAAVAAAEAAPGLLGLHLEGPHLDPLRKGAHDAGLIRPMNSADLHHLCEAAQQLPALMITVAPEAVTPEQIAVLDSAGAIVSLGHSDCSYETAVAAIAAGARCVTHLFNAMSQLGNRNPGLVGAALTHDVAAGLIADTIHVHPATMRAALAAKPHGVFLVSDGMAFAGSDLQEITLGGRKILRHSGRLTLADGNLAGADLTQPQAIRNMV